MHDGLHLHFAFFHDKSAEREDLFYVNFPKRISRESLFYFCYIKHHNIVFPVLSSLSSSFENSKLQVEKWNNPFPRSSNLGKSSKQQKCIRFWSKKSTYSIEMNFYNFVIQKAFIFWNVFKRITFSYEIYVSNHQPNQNATSLRNILVGI